MQKFTGRIVGTPEILETTNTKRKVLHVRVSFVPNVGLRGKLPDIKDGAISSIQLSFWDEEFQNAVMHDADDLVGKVITGYCDNVTKREQYYNGTGYVFVMEKPDAKFRAPEFQMLVSEAPTAPTAPVSL